MPLTRTRLKSPKLSSCLLVLATLSILTLPAHAATLPTKILNAVPQDPTPGELEASEYLIGSVAVGIVFVESNGRIDSDIESWTSEQEAQTIGKIQYTFAWWQNQNPAANVSFKMDIHYRVPTSYEPITRPYADRNLWVNEVMNNLGYKALFFETHEREFVNDLRRMFQTDWAFMIFLVSAFNDTDGRFSDRRIAYAFQGGPSITTTVAYSTNLEWILAHEIAHIFWATDEYDEVEQKSGYLNVPDVEGSGCLMETWGSWDLSGKPHGLNGTWGQVGWRDSDGDGIQDIVDTCPSVTLNTLSLDPANYTLQCTGIASENPYPNSNPSSIYRNSITINKVQSVQFRLDGKEWKEAAMTPTTSANGTKNITAVVSFTFTIPFLELGNHTLEVRAFNNWGNEGLTVQTMTVPGSSQVMLTLIEPYRNILSNNTTTSINVTAQNCGFMIRNFNVTLYCEHVPIQTKSLYLSGDASLTMTFRWNTSSVAIGNFTIRAVATEDKDQNVTILCTALYHYIQTSIRGDINGDGTVNIIDVSTAAKTFGAKPNEPRWNANADIDEDGQVNIVDLTMITKRFGEKI
jgi:predicted lipoprotein with Yx(FWY)xxD motif